MSYVGQIVELPLGDDGLTGSKNFSQISPALLLQALNVSYEEGTITKEGGSSKYNSVTLGAISIIGGWDWWPDAATQRMVVYTSAGTILKDSGLTTFPVLLKSGATSSTNVPIFVEGGKEVAANNRKLFIFPGGNPVQVLSGDGATTSNLSAPPADWTGVNQPVGGCIHENRLWGWGNPNDPHRVYASLPTNHEDFTTTPYSLSIYPGEGERIVAGMSYKGGLILWKHPVGVYMVDTSNPTSSNWRPIRITQGAGMTSPGAVVVTDDDVLYMDRDGNYQFLSASDAFGDLTSRNLTTISAMHQFVRDNLHLGRLHLSRGVYYPAKREAHFSCSSLSATTQNRRLIVDFNRPDLPRFRFSDKDVCQSLWLRKDSNNIPRLMSGDSAGFVWHLDQTIRSKDGVAYVSKFQTVHTDLAYADKALANKRKLGDFLEIVCNHRSNSTLYIDVVWDGRVKESIPFEMGGDLTAWNSGATWRNFRWGGSRVISRRKRITGSGIRLSLIVRNGQANEDFSLAKALLYFRPGDERLP